MQYKKSSLAHEVPEKWMHRDPEHYQILNKFLVDYIRQYSLLD